MYYQNRSRIQRDSNKTREFAQKLLFDVKGFVPRDNFFIICYNIKEPETFWVIPSKIFKQYAYFLKKYGKLRLIINNEDSEMRKKLHFYRNNFFQLKEGTTEATKELKQTIKKSGWRALKELYPNVSAVENKLKEAKEKKFSQGYIKILENLKKYWGKRK